MIKALVRVGFIAVRQKGSHVILRKEMPERTRVTVVPLHDEVDRGTLLEIIRQAGMSRDDFLKLL